MLRQAVARPRCTTESPSSGGGRGARRRVARALAALGLLAAAGPAGAHAQDPTGGTAPAAPGGSATARLQKLAPPATANLYGRSAPRVRRLDCRSACGTAGAARPGALLRVHGRRLAPLAEVVFLGAAGDADDTSVAPRRVRRRSVLARVPRTAVSGPVVVVRPDGTRSPASRRALKVEPRPAPVPAGIVAVEVQRSKVFFGAPRSAELSFVVGGSRPASVEIELVRAANGTVVARWTPGQVAAGSAQSVRWDGTVDGDVGPEGLYQFRVRATDTAGGQASSSAAGGAVAGPGAPGAPGARTSQTGAVAPGAPGAFTFLRHRFPLIGRHDYAEQAARFGGGRGHQGQDVFAACGTPVVAARGGVVKFRDFQSAAGNYLVIDGARTDVDFAYMHLRETALVDAGERVRTGQPLGFVGATGRASGCHLHFEEWSAPGWYSGGSAFDPLPDLRAWDTQS
jgi:murein DD-endopeptidase MepM/ murein hydrolase activator NlpD